MTSDPAEIHPDGLPEWLHTDLESEIHQHLNHDGQPDETNDWVSNLVAALTPHILRWGTDETEALRGIVQRVNDGWQYTKSRPLPPIERGIWWRIQDADHNWTLTSSSDPQQEPMTEAEQVAIYGSVVRKEETSNE